MIKGPKKVDFTTHDVMESIAHADRSKLVDMVFDGAEAALDKTQTPTSRFVNIPVTEITPRSINQYKQNRIDRLAKSIRNTNNRLIHPIVVVEAKDLPEDGEVMQRFAAQGTDLSSLKYIIVAGERRYRAWLKLRDEEEDNPDRKYYEPNPFDTITANVLTKQEAANEGAFFEDSNIETRQLTPMEGILHIQDALSEVDTDEKKREALIEMNGGSAEGIPGDPAVAAKKFNQAKYCEYYLSAELGIEGWSYGTIKMYLSFVNNCCEEVINSIISGELSAGAARGLTGLSEDEQKAALEEYNTNGLATYNEFLKELALKKASPKKQNHFTHKDAQKQIKASLKKIVKEKDEIKKMVDKLGGTDKATAKKAADEFENFIRKMEKCIEELA